MKRKALRIMAGLIAENSEENVIKDTYPIYHKQ